MLWNCWVRDLKCFTGIVSKVGALGITIRRSICLWYLSDGVTGQPVNGWFEGIVGKKVA